MNERDIEHRKCLRVCKELDALIKSEYEESAFSKIKNINVSGMLCLCERNYETMSRLEVTISIPSSEGSNEVRKVNCEGMVVRSKYALEPEDDMKHEIAVFFTLISTEGRRLIAELVKEA